MKVAEAVGHALVAEGIRLAVGIGGTHIGKIIDAIIDREEISLMYPRQERVAFDICDGYARSSGNPALVFTDSGPAAANLMGGLVNSWGDSTPVLFIAGHVDRSEVMKAGTKEIPFLELFRPVSKWAELMNDPSQVSEIMRRAFVHLRTGRPGPVVLGIPHDVSQMEIGDFTYEAVSAKPRVRSGGDPAAIQQAVELLANAKNPYIFVGAGVLQSEATNELVRLSDLLTAPVATTLNGKSAFPENHPLSLGIGGFSRAYYGSLPASLTGDAADVILTVGAGFKMHSLWDRPKQPVKHIQVDVDPAEIHRDHIADIALLGDAKVVLSQMIEAAKKLSQERQKPVQARLDEVKSLQQRWTDVCRPLTESEEAPLNPFRVTADFMKLVDPAKTIVLHDAGTVRGTLSQHYVATTPRGFLGFGGQSAMGWALGAGMGAKKANPDKLVAVFVGEEAFNETAMDLETSIRNDAPVLVVIKNNRKNYDQSGGKHQRLAYARFHRGVNLGAFATALGAKTYRVEKPDQLAETLKKAIADVEAGTTCVVEVMTVRINATLTRLWDKNAASKKGE